MLRNLDITVSHSISMKKMMLFHVRTYKLELLYLLFHVPNPRPAGGPTTRNKKLHKKPQQAPPFFVAATTTSYFTSHQLQQQHTTTPPPPPHHSPFIQGCAWVGDEGPLRTGTTTCYYVLRGGLPERIFS